MSFLRLNLKVCPEKLKEPAYFSLVRAFLGYSATLWDPYQQYNIDKIEMVQHRNEMVQHRFVKGRYRRTESVSTMLDELGWSSVSARRKDARLILFYTIINNLAHVPHKDILAKTYERTRSKNMPNMIILQISSN